MIIIIRILFTASGRCLSVSQPITTTCRINVHLQPLLGQVCFNAALLLTERCFTDRTRQQVSAVSVGINYNNDDPIPTTPQVFATHYTQQLQKVLLLLSIINCTFTDSELLCLIFFFFIFLCFFFRLLDNASSKVYNKCLKK